MCTKLVRICWGRTTSCFVYWFVFQVIIEKTIWTRILQGNWERFLYEKDRNYNYCKFSCKFTFTYFLFFHRNQKQESYFQQGGGLVTRNSFAIYLQRVALYLKGMPNFVDFIKGPVAPAPIIVPWSKPSCSFVLEQFHCFNFR